MEGCSALCWWERGRLCSTSEGKLRSVLLGAAREGRMDGGKDACLEGENSIQGREETTLLVWRFALQDSEDRKELHSALCQGKKAV